MLQRVLGKNGYFEHGYFSSELHNLLSIYYISENEPYTIYIYTSFFVFFALGSKSISSINLIGYILRNILRVRGYYFILNCNLKNYIYLFIYKFS